MGELCNKALIAATDEALYVYHDVPGSAMSKFDQGRLDTIYLTENLECFFREKRPDFYVMYKKYATASMYWSMAWQAAVKLTREEFYEFCRTNAIKYKFRRLFLFKNYKVALSSIIGYYSIWTFRYFSMLFGRSRVH